tara:strand:+ start:157 stop:363 length:207 start_codon:yes stop_codon:yes gene_type:complete
MASRDWVKFNEDSRAKRNREKHVSQNGGSFVKGKRGWEWVAPEPVKKKAAPAAKKKTATTKKKLFGKK